MSFDQLRKRSSIRLCAARAVPIGLAVLCMACGQSETGAVDEPIMTAQEAFAENPTCTSSAQCTGGTTCCQGFCVDTSRDPLNCGNCTTTCAFPLLGCCAGACQQRIDTSRNDQPPLASIGGSCGLLYHRYTNLEESGASHVLPDFSHAGYRGGGVPIPAAIVRETLSPNANETPLQTRDRIQAAIDRVSALPLGPNGMRGAVQLNFGTYRVGSRAVPDPEEPNDRTKDTYIYLDIKASGVVLRGTGQGKGPTNTLVIAADTERAHSLITVGGVGKTAYPVDGAETPIIVDAPVGTTEIQVQSVAPFSAGDYVFVRRTPNQTWIDGLHVPHLSNPNDYNTCVVCKRNNPNDCDDCNGATPWAPNDWEIPDPQNPEKEILVAQGFAVDHLRRVRAVKSFSSTLIIDIPIVDAIEARYGGGTVKKVTLVDPVTLDGGFVSQSGVENMRLESEYASKECEDPEDGPCAIDDHGSVGVELAGAQNSWVRKVTVQYFGMSAVQVRGNSRFNTIEEVAHLDPVSLIKGGRRYSFNVTTGIGNLFQRCYARGARHAFVTGRHVTGPNVWLDCVGTQTLNDDGPHQRWATGLLFDNVRTGQLHVQNRLDSASGHGWPGAQVMFWNTQTEDFVNSAPRSAMNWTVGAVGPEEAAYWAPEETRGWWEQAGTLVNPRSLYLQQLTERLGPGAVNATTSPQQRTGRIWRAIQEWAGEGDLSDFYSPSSCVSGSDVELSEGNANFSPTFLGRFRGASGRRYSGTLISPDLFLTSYQDGVESIIDLGGISTRPRVGFNCQLAAGAPIPPTEDLKDVAASNRCDWFNVVQVWQYPNENVSVLRLEKDQGEGAKLVPGSIYGWVLPARKTVTIGEPLAMFEHPWAAGERKMVGFGTVSSLSGDDFLSSVSSSRGSLGAGVVDRNGLLVGMHQSGGCEGTSSASRARSMSYVIDRVPEVRNQVVAAWMTVI